MAGAAGAPTHAQSIVRTRIGRTCKVLRWGRGQVFNCPLGGLGDILSHPRTLVPQAARGPARRPDATSSLVSSGRLRQPCFACLSLLAFLAPEELVHVFQGVGVCGVEAQSVFICLPHLQRERGARERSALRQVLGVKGIVLNCFEQP